MSWAPNETAAQLWVERANLDGVGLGNVAYGAYLTLFFLCVSALWTGRTRAPRHSRAMLAYVAAVFALTTVGNAAQMRVLELAFVDARNYPGGPGAFEEYAGSITINVVGTACFVVSAWFADGLLLYRFWVIWNSSWLVMVLPIMAYLLSIVSSSMLLAQISLPGSSLWEHTAVDFALLFWCSSIAVTLCATLAIAGRLLLIRARVAAAVGPDPARQRSPYLSVSAMIAESALAYAAVALVFIVTYVRGDTFNFVVFPVLANVQAIAPLLIIFRVAQGRGWTTLMVRQTTLLTTNAGDVSLDFLRAPPQDPFHRSHETLHRSHDTLHRAHGSLRRGHGGGSGTVAPAPVMRQPSSAGSAPSLRYEGSVGKEGSACSV